ncbi:hypothetical protein P5673_000961 [Acropora cervicornis]|uniref:Uncharacterized protein n=1 Tax=Acropora cervicornis TaxID=6130 RepID=A0AAD9VG74_ACRCE|nr:hypothetical protein P5673_000961 [Acropora cervicornis]
MKGPFLEKRHSTHIVPVLFVVINSELSVDTKFVEQKIKLQMRLQSSGFDEDIANLRCRRFELYWNSANGLRCTVILLPAMFHWVRLSDDCCTCRTLEH